MSATVTTLTIDANTKKITQSGDYMAEREEIEIHLTGGIDLLSGASYILSVIDYDTNTMLAYCDSFSVDGTELVGTLNLNTTEMVDYFDARGLFFRSKLPFEVAIWDTANNALVASDKLSIYYNPYSDQMSQPSSASPIGQVYTTAEKSKLAGIETSADVTDATNVNAAGAVMESDYNANTILAATADNTPLPVTISEQRLVGRITGGNITGLTATQTRTLLNVEDGADVTDAANVQSSLEGIFTSTGLLERSATNTYGNVTITTFCKSLIDDAAASNARTTLGLGTAAVLNVGTSANEVVQLSSVGQLPTLPKDIEINSTVAGLILKDRSTEARFRLYVDNSTINIEEVS